MTLRTETFGSPSGLDGSELQSARRPRLAILFALAVGLAATGSAPVGSAMPAPSAFDLVGGATTAVTIDPRPSGALAFAVVGAHVVAFDLAEPARLRELGRTPLLPEVPQDLALSGGLLYVAGRPAGNMTAGWLHVYDARDPAAIALLGTTTIQAREVGAIAVAFAHAYLLTDRGLAVVDVKSPRHPREEATVEIGRGNVLAPTRSPGGLAVLGTRLVVARPEGVSAFELDPDPGRPACAARFDALGAAYDVAPAGERALVATERGVALLDPSGQDVTAELRLAGGPRAVAAAGDRALVLPDGGRRILRLRGLAAGRLELDGEAELATAASEDLSVALSGDWALVASGRAGLSAVSVSGTDLRVWQDATAEPIVPPVEAADASGRLVFAAAGASGLYVLHDDAGPAGLRTIAAFQPVAPATDGSLRPMAFHGLRHVDGTVYATTERHGLVAIDVRDPAHPALGPGLPDLPGLHGPHEIARVGPVLYIPADDGALYAVDTAAPAGPAVVARWAHLDGRAALAVGPYVYVSAVGAFGLGHVHVIDARDARAPRYLGTVDLAHFASRVAAGRGHLFLSGNAGELAVLDLANPAVPVEVYRGRGLDIGRVAVVGTRLLLARPEGLDSLDISSPASPAPTGDPLWIPWGSTDWPGASDVVAVDGGLIVLRHQAGLLRLAGSPWTPSVARLPALPNGPFAPVEPRPELAPPVREPGSCAPAPAVSLVLDVSAAAEDRRPALAAALAALLPRLATRGIAIDLVTVDRQAAWRAPGPAAAVSAAHLGPMSRPSAGDVRLDLGLAAAERALAARGLERDGRIVLLLAGDPDAATWRLALERAAGLRAVGRELRAVQMSPARGGLLPALAVLVGSAGHARGVHGDEDLSDAILASITDCTG